MQAFDDDGKPVLHHCLWLRDVRPAQRDRAVAAAASARAARTVPTNRSARKPILALNGWNGWFAVLYRLVPLRVEAVFAGSRQLSELPRISSSRLSFAPPSQCR